MHKDFPPLRYVVDGYVAEGLTLLAGAAKVRKSWLALDMGLAVAGDGIALGSIPCEQGDVLYLALEDNERELKRRLGRMGVTAPPERLTLCTEWPIGGEAVAEIGEWADAVELPTLVIVDVLARVRPFTGGEVSYEADYGALRGLKALADRLGLAIVVIHHTRKMKADDPFDEVSGTRGLTAAADTTLILRRDHTGVSATRARIYGRGRAIRDIETALDFCDGDCRWKVLGEAHEVASTVERQDILDVLHGSVEGLALGEIAEVLGKSKPNVAKMLRKLLEAGLVTKPATGRYVAVKAVKPVDDYADALTALTGLTDPQGCPRCAGAGCEWCDQ